MTTKTKADLSNTVLHFFINNGNRWIGVPGVFHTRVQTDDSSFNQVKAWLEASDYPAAELGETDINLYGRELVGNPWYVKFPDGSSNGLPTDAWLFLTETNRRTVNAERSLAEINQKLDSILAKLGK